MYVFEKVRVLGSEPGINNCHLESVCNDVITSINRSPVFTIILDSGTYYFGFDENTANVEINYSLRSMIDFEVDTDGTLVTDPVYNQGFELGSEVIFNIGLCNGNTITEGFTRCLYLMVENMFLQPISRLDYNWYSSNENVATVSQYGTVLAKPADSNSTVTIYAILKADPSVVYRKTFTILNDVSTDIIEIECEMSFSYSASNGLYQLRLNTSNCPYPMIQYYDWNIHIPCQENEISVSIGTLGHITASRPGVAIIYGIYELNPRVALEITLRITE